MGVDCGSRSSRTRFLCVCVVGFVFFLLFFSIIHVEWTFLVASLSLHTSLGAEDVVYDEIGGSGLFRGFIDSRVCHGDECSVVSLTLIVCVRPP